MAGAAPAFYVPRRAGGQSWWVATAAWTEPREPSTHPVPSYLVFTQVSGKWMQALEPDVLTGATPPPQVITHQAGYAPTVTVKDLHRRRARRRLHCAHARDTTHPMTPN